MRICRNCDIIDATISLKEELVNSQYHAPAKTLGPQAAGLVVALYERDRPVFTVKEAADITGLGPSAAARFLHKLARRGILTHLGRGLYRLIPFELGSAREFLGNPFVIVREFARGADYYVSHASAMDIHGMLTQPQLVVYATSPKQIRSREVLGTVFRLVRCKANHFFGTFEHWADKQEKIVVSDLERTVLDGLKQPQYTGGITEVAKGMWMRRDGLSVPKLVDYALRLGIGAVVRRLGFLLELYELGPSTELDRLRDKLSSTYMLLDPLLSPGGKYLSRWRLRLNVIPEELQTVVRT